MPRCSIILIVATVAIAAVASAQDCLEYGEPLRVLPPGDAIEHPYGVAGSGHVVFVAAGPDGLLVYEIPTVGDLVRRAELALDGVAYDVDLRGNHLLIAGGTAGLHVVDVADPFVPQSVVTLPVPGAEIREVFLAGDEAYLLGSNWNCEGQASDLVRVNVADPTAPVLLDVHPEGAHGTDMDLAGGLAALAVTAFAWEQLGPDWWDCVPHSSFRLLDVADPVHPVVLADHGSWNVSGVAFVGDHLYVAESDLVVYDVADPSAPVEVAGLDVGNGPWGLARFGATVYVTTQDRTLVAIDASVPAAPVIAGSIELPLACHDLAAAGEYLVAIAEAGGVCAVKVGDPAAPILPTGAAAALGHVAISPPAGAMAVAGTLAYVCGQQITAIDASNPDAPAVLGAAPSQMIAPVTAAVAGAVLVVGGLGFTGLAISTYDVSTPAAPVLLGSLPATWFNLIPIDDETVVNIATDAVSVLDVGGPGGPAVLGTIAGPPGVSSGAYQNGWLYLTGGVPGQPVLAVYAAADALAPQFVTEVALPEACVVLVVDGARAYACSREHVTVLSLDDPGAPEVKGSAPIHAWPDVNAPLASADGPRFYLRGARSLDAYDVTVAEAPLRLGLQPFNLYGLAAQGELVYALDPSGFYVLPPACLPTVGVVTPPDFDEPPASLPAGIRLLGAAPNPFNPLTDVAFELDRACQVTLAIYDLAGREVTRLVAGERAAGRHVVRWSGQDHHGVGVASGTYVARLETPTSVQVKKLTLLK